MISVVKIMRKDIGMRIKSYRQMRGLSQSALGEKVGVSNRAVSNWESGVNGIDVDLLPEICAALEISADDLLLTSPNSILSSKALVVAHKYDRLDDSGRELIDLVIDHELERTHAASPISGITQEDLQRGAEKTAQPDGKAANR